MKTESQASTPPLVYHKNGPHYPVDPHREILQVENSRSQLRGWWQMLCMQIPEHPWKPHNTPSSRWFSSTPFLTLSHPLSFPPASSLPLPQHYRSRSQDVHCDKDFPLFLSFSFHHLRSCLAFSFACTMRVSSPFDSSSLFSGNN